MAIGDLMKVLQLLVWEDIHHHLPPPRSSKTSHWITHINRAPARCFPLLAKENDLSHSKSWAHCRHLSTFTWLVSITSTSERWSGANSKPAYEEICRHKSRAAVHCRFRPGQHEGNAKLFKHNSLLNMFNEVLGIWRYLQAHKYWLEKD